MFKQNKKSKNPSNMDKKTKGKNRDIASVDMVSEGTEIVGTLITEGDIRIAGTVDGEAKVDGKVIVASTGHVDGNINAVNADIAGRVEGEVRVESRLTLRQSAVVECDIYAQSLIVEEGATFNGECHMRDYESDNAYDTEKDGSNEIKTTAGSPQEGSADKVKA